MGFELQVKLTGLCMFGIQPSTKSIIVVMPDTRFRTDAAGAEVPMKHPDGKDAKPHVGYLRFNLANLAPSIANVPPSNITTAPPYEVIHRFDGEELELVLEDDDGDITATTQDLRLPNFDDFAPVIEGIPTVFDISNKKPPSQTLMRTVLTGGRVRSVGEGEKWYITGELHPDGQRRDAGYDGDIEWRRWVDAAQLTLKIRSFKGNKKPVEITLTPTSFGGPKPTIPLKIANLCSTNPMEWDELELRRVREADVDFKWFYQLVQLKAGENSIQYPASVVPHPHPVVESEAKEGILADCFPSRITLSSTTTSPTMKAVRAATKKTIPSVVPKKTRSATKKKGQAKRGRKR